MSKQDGGTELLEHGDIFFLYRPRIDEDEPEGAGDIQRFFIVLRPAGGRHLRLMVVGRKRLPDVEAHERNWGFVDMVVDSAGKIEKELREETHETKTRGEQRTPAARPAGEGVYAITLEGGQMHLSYELELPEKGGEVQRALKVAPVASFALSIKNPDKGQPKGAGLRGGEKADYPKRLQEEFRGRRFEREDVHLLDFEGAEFILVGARANPEERYDLDLPAEHEDYEHAEVVRRLGMVEERHPVTPLFEGKWA